MEDAKASGKDAKVVKRLNYTEAVEYIYSVPKFTKKNKPSNTRELMDRLGHAASGLKADRYVYLPASGEDQRAVPD